MVITLDLYLLLHFDFPNCGFLFNSLMLMSLSCSSLNTHCFFCLLISTVLYFFLYNENFLPFFTSGFYYTSIFVCVAGNCVDTPSIYRDSLMRCKTLTISGIENNANSNEHKDWNVPVTFLLAYMPFLISFLSRAEWSRH